MKKYLAIIGMTAMSLSSLNASGIISVNGQNNSKGSESSTFDSSSDYLIPTHPYQKTNHSQTFYGSIGYAGGTFGPQNRVIAIESIESGFSNSCETGSWTQFPLSWTNGITFGLGYVDSGKEGPSVVVEGLFVCGDNQKFTHDTNEVYLNMRANHPINTFFNNDTSINYASGRYVNNGHLDIKVFITRDILASSSTGVAFESGLAGTVTDHKLTISYAYEQLLKETKLKNIHHESIKSVGPWFRINARQAFPFNGYIEGKIAASTQVANHYLSKFDDVTLADASKRSASYKIENESVFNISHSIETSVGIGFLFMFSKGKALDATLSWNGVAKPNYTYISAPAFGVGAGTTQPWMSNSLQSSIKMRF